MKKLFIVLLSLISLVGCAQVVNVGALPNNGGGDSWRNAFMKINIQFGRDSLKWKSDIAAQAVLTQDQVDARVTNHQLSSRTSTATDSMDVTDFNKIVFMNSASANNFTIVANSVKTFAVGGQITVIQMGAGQTTIVAGAGVTINSADGLKIAAQYGFVTLYQQAANVWFITGKLTN